MGDAPATSKAPVPSLQTRHAACTHTSMVRLYGDYKCNNCNRTSGLGWLYRCVQDYNGELPTIDEIREGIFGITSKDTGDFSRDRNALEDTQLSPWIEKAITEGHYTEDQIAIMRAQKIKAQGTIVSAEKAFRDSINSKRTSLRPKLLRSLSDSRTASTSQSIDPSPGLPYPIITELETGTETPSTPLGLGISSISDPPLGSESSTLSSTLMMAEALTTLFTTAAPGSNVPAFATSKTGPAVETTNYSAQASEKDDNKSDGPGEQRISNASPATAKVKLRMFPKCNYNVCQACRPTYRERAWQSFEDIYAKSERLSLDRLYTITDNCPMSHANLVRNLGLRNPPPISGTSEAIESTNSKRKRKSRSSSRPSNEIDDYKGEEAEEWTDEKAEIDINEVSAGFRKSIIRAYRSMLARHQSRLNSSKNRIHSNRLRRTRRSIDQGSEEDGQEFNMGLWQEMNEELLHEASEVRLPGNDGMDDLDHEAGEVEVENGVAVTEEGVDLRAADVIMSA